MFPLRTRSVAAFAIAITCAAAFSPSAARAQSDSLKFVDNPGGGQIVYGSVSKNASMSDSMAMVLRNVHSHYGDRPKIGKFFKARNSETVATFFTLTAKNQGGKQIAGMVIVSKTEGGPAAAAILTDDADRFGKTASSMLKKLNEVWARDFPRSARVSSNAGSGSELVREAAAKPLRTATFPDNSGTVGLPVGWQITSGGGGAVHTAGPNGETVHLGVIDQGIYDPRNPKAQQMMQYLNKGHNPYLVCPYGGDLFAAFQTVSREVAQRLGIPTPSLTLISRRNVTPSPYEVAAILVLAEQDDHKGVGPMTSSIRIGAMREGGSGAWAMTVTAISVPKQLAEEEWPTMNAIVASFRQNGAVIGQQTSEVIATIHAIGDAATARAKAQGEANDARNAAIDRDSDAKARANTNFENYTLDRTVVKDTETGEHGTIGYGFADSLVKANPDRYQYVTTPEFLRGIDY